MNYHNLIGQEIQLRDAEQQIDRTRQIVEISHQLSQLSEYTLNNVYRVLKSANATSLYKMNHQEKSQFVIQPKGKQIGLWNLIVILLIYLICFQLSIILCFGPEFWNMQLQIPAYLAIYIFFITMLFADIIVNLNKGYYLFGQAKSVMDRTRIIKKYILGQFIIDIINIGLLLFVLLKNHIFYNLLQILTIILLHVKKYKYQQQIKVILLASRLKLNIFTIVMVLFDFLFLAVLAGCLFTGIDILLWNIQYYGNNTQYYFLSNNSLYGPDLLPGSPLTQFIYGQSWAFSTLSTQALGPDGKNPIQHVFEIVVMILFVILFSYAAEVVIIIDENSTTQKLIQENNLENFNRFMNLKEIRMRIKIKVLKFFELITDFELQNYIIQSEMILEKLPTNLREQMSSEIAFTNRLQFMKYFQQYPYLSKSLAEQINMKVFDPKAILFSKGEIVYVFEQPQILFIRQGLGLFYFPFFGLSGDYKNTIGISHKKKILCQYEFITGLAYSYSCKSIDLCVVLQVPFRVIRQALKKMSLEENYFEIRAKLLYEKQTYLINQQCLICSEYHKEDKCPQLFIKEQILKQINKNEQQLSKIIRKDAHRNKFKRKVHQNLNTKIFNISEQQRQSLIVKQMEAIERVKSKFYLNDDSDLSMGYSKYFNSFNI